jgi:D-tyrosyl-tRNA(Tyr) deacylase
MRIILQRVSKASVTVDGETIASVGRGLLILLGVGRGDGRAEADALAEKCAQLRMFDDAAGKTNRSLQDVKGEALVVSQFTLCADTRKGRRPSFTDAAAPEIAAPLVDYFAEKLRGLGLPTQTGRFGADMRVELVNEGPFTILLENPSR